MAHIFLFFICLALLTGAMAANSTQEFLLYKNTHFGPCSASLSSIFSHENSGNEIRPGIFTHRRLSADDFCNRFWNYTILPSAPTEGAFVYTWANALINFASNALLLFSYGTYGGDDDDDDDNLTRSRSWLTRLWHWLIRLRYWPTFLYGLIEVVLWCFSFVKIVAHPHEPRALLSPMAAMTTLIFGMNMPWIKKEDSVSEWFWIPVGLVLLWQIIGGGVALIIFFSQAQVPQYVLDPSFDVSSFVCDVHTLLFDPTNQKYVVVLGLGPIVVAYVAIIIGLVLLIYDITEKADWIFIIAPVFLAVSSLVISLSVLATSDTNPITWNPGCGIVHVAMGSGYGLWDAKGAGILHKLQSFFTVIF
ncbi:hypothetical protein DL96DRAFT_1764543 [Flagelloscypha sp. PMI_526]|nr:hypothetical protein DL96DRAFT_1764543 [Flagelloscypha sp. PMI_526]